MYTMGLSNGTITEVLNVFCIARVKRDRFSEVYFQNDQPIHKRIELIVWGLPRHDPSWKNHCPTQQVSYYPYLHVPKSWSVFVNLYIHPQYCLFNHHTWFCHSHDIICYCTSCTNALFLSIYIFIPNIVLQLSSPISSLPRYSLLLHLRQGISHVCLTISPKGELVWCSTKTKVNV